MSKIKECMICESEALNDEIYCKDHFCEVVEWEDDSEYYHQEFEKSARHAEQSRGN